MPIPIDVAQRDRQAKDRDWPPMLPDPAVEPHMTVAKIRKDANGGAHGGTAARCRLQRNHALALEPRR